MKKVIILLAALGLLGGGGFFAWSQVSSGPEPTDEKAEAAVEKKAPAKKKKRKPTDDVFYVEMPPITVPFIRDGAFAQYVVLVVNLEVSSRDDMDLVQKNQPRLRDAFVSELHSLATTRSRNQRLINLARIKSRLLAGADRVLGVGVVDAVLVQLAH